MGFATDAIHGDRSNNDELGAVVDPLHLSTTFAWRSVDDRRRFTYSRHNNPTREALERRIARLEGGSEARAFASGMAAITAIFSMFKAGDHFVVTNNIYSGTNLALRRVSEHSGIDVSFTDSSNLVALRQAINGRTKLVFVETPTNPLLKITDIKGVAGIANDENICFCVDNSCMTPYLQKPLSLGADIVVHSTSKYFSGHNDSIGGVIVTDNPDIAETFSLIQSTNGAVLSPFDCWLLMRGIKTLALRMDAHSQSGQLIAEYLSNHKLVHKVFYPGLQTHPNHDLARRQCRGFGGLISIELGDDDRAVRFLNNLKLFTLAESVGSVQSLACHPYSMTFGKLTAEEKERMGIAPELVRLSAGIEDVEDLIEDIDNAFSKAG